MRVLSGGKINPLIGAAGIRLPDGGPVVQREGIKYNKKSYSSCMPWGKRRRPDRIRDCRGGDASVLAAWDHIVKNYTLLLFLAEYNCLPQTRDCY